MKMDPRNTKKPLAFYYLIAMIVIMLLVILICNTAAHTIGAAIAAGVWALFTDKVKFNVTK